MREPADWSRIGRIVTWLVVGGVVAVVIVVVGYFVVLYHSLSGPDPEPRKSPEQIAALEQRLAERGTADEALAQREQDLQDLADDISAIVPGIAWRWNRESSYQPCGGELTQTRGIQKRTRNLISDRPIPDAQYEQALALVRDRARELGVAVVNGVSLDPDRPELEGGIDLLKGEIALLQGTTGCRLP